MAKSNAHLASWRRYFHYDPDLEPEPRELSTPHAKGKVVCILDKSGPGRPPERWYPAGQSHTPPPDDARPERKNEETSKAPAVAQAGAGVHSFPRSLVGEAHRRRP